jgi:hypothetical protein
LFSGRAASLLTPAPRRRNIPKPGVDAGRTSPDRSRTARVAKTARERAQEIESDLMISNMQHRIHEMNMEIIRNIGGYKTRAIYVP